MISGFGSSNIEILLQSYRRLEEAPIRTLESKKSSIDERLDLFNDLKSKLSTLDSIVTELSYTGSVSIFGNKAATSSDEAVATVTADSTAVATSHTLFVSQLAKADKIVSNQYTLTGTDLVGSLGAGNYTFDVTVNGTATPVSVTLDAADDNEAVINKIITAVNNDSGIGVKASLVKDSGTTGRLVFTSENSGKDFEMTLADTSGTLLSTMGMDDSVKMSGTSGGYIYDTTELNAMALVDGISVESNSNTLSDALNGLTINLKKVQATGEAPVTINVENDVESIKGKVQEFIDAYNAVLDFVKSNTAVNSTTYERGPLSGDFTVTNLKMQFRTQMANAITGLSAGDPTTLAAIGIETATDGTLSITDTDKLENMIRDNLDQVEQLFNSSDGYAGRLTTIVDSMTGGEGIIAKRKTIYESQITAINNRIDLLEKSVDKKMEYYQDQFAQLQAAYAQFSSQSSFISALSFQFSGG